jgi:hypothetical protein
MRTNPASRRQRPADDSDTELWPEAVGEAHRIRKLEGKPGALSHRDSPTAAAAPLAPFPGAGAGSAGAPGRASGVHNGLGQSGVALASGAVGRCLAPQTGSWFGRNGRQNYGWFWQETDGPGRTLRRRLAGERGLC